MTRVESREGADPTDRDGIRDDGDPDDPSGARQPAEPDLLWIESVSDRFFGPGNPFTRAGLEPEDDERPPAVPEPRRAPVDRSSSGPTASPGATRPPGDRGRRDPADGTRRPATEGWRPVNPTPLPRRSARRWPEPVEYGSRPGPDARPDGAAGTAPRQPPAGQQASGTTAQDGEAGARSRLGELSRVVDLLAEGYPPPDPVLSALPPEELLRLDRDTAAPQPSEATSGAPTPPPVAVSPATPPAAVTVATPPAAAPSATPAGAVAGAAAADPSVPDAIAGPTPPPAPSGSPVGEPAAAHPGPTAAAGSERVGRHGAPAVEGPAPTPAVQADTAPAPRRGRHRHPRTVEELTPADLTLRLAFRTGDEDLAAAALALVTDQERDRQRLRTVRAYLDALLDEGVDGLPGARRLRSLLED